MIITPFGPIKLYADGVALEYEAVSHDYDRPPVKGHPIAGGYRIHVPVGAHRSIRCELLSSNAPIRNTGDSGQGYLDAEFENGTIDLRIGAEDENPPLDK